MKKNRTDDYCGMEADCLLTIIMYERVNASKVKYNVLTERIKFLRNLIFKK